MQLRFKAHAKQKEALTLLSQDNGVSEIVYGGAKNGGKSFLGVTHICGSALLYPNTRWFIARKELNDLRKYTLPTVYKWFEAIGLKFSVYCKYNGQDNFLELHNGSRVYFLGAPFLPSDPMFERFGSMEMTGGWIEEGGEIDEQAKENLKLSIGRYRNDEYNIPIKLLITCNPKKNWLYRDFYKPHKQGTLPLDKAFIRALVTDNTFRAKGAVEALDKIKDRITKQRLRFGDWEYVDDPACLITYDNIISIFTNSHIPLSGIKYMTVDVARFGEDKSKIRVWQGWRVIYVESITKKPITYTAQRVKELQVQHQVAPSNTIIDEDGIGGGVVDLCPKGTKGFIANSTPIYAPAELDPKTKKPHVAYANLKTQCAYILSFKVNAKQVYEEVVDIEAQDNLIIDLEQLKSKDVDTDGKQRIISKEEMKKAIGRSTDDGDTYIMRAYFELNNSPLIKI